MIFRDHIVVDSLDVIGNLLVNSDPGTTGQVLISQGVGVPPVWAVNAALLSGGTTDTLTKWTSASTLGNSSISESGSITYLPTNDFKVLHGSLTLGSTGSGSGHIIFANIANSVTNTINTNGSGSSWSWLLPATQGANNSILSNDGGGNLFWSNTQQISNAPSTLTVTGTTITLTAGENLAFGDIIYIKSDGLAWKANATDNTKVLAIGMVTATILTGNPGIILLSGTATLSSWTWTVGSTSPIYLFTTSGGMTQTQPSTTGNIIQVLGFPLSATTILFNPSVDYITHA